MLEGRAIGKIGHQKSLKAYSRSFAEIITHVHLNKEM